MNKNGLVILTLLTLLSCSKPKTEFEIAFSKYEQIKLPIQFNSNRDFDLKGITRDSIGLGGVAYGRLFQTDNYFASVYLSIPVYRIIPSIYIQDREGNIIDSFGCCVNAGEEPGWSSVQSLTILPDKSIVFVDSVQTYEFKADSAGLKEVEGTRKLKVTKEKSTITETGKIKKIE